MEEKYKETVVLKVGASTVLELPFSAHPMPEVSWTYKKKPLALSKRLKVETIIGMTALTLSKAVRKDSGTYSLTLQNEFGKATLSVKVIVIGMQFHFHTPLVLFDAWMLNVTKLKSSYFLLFEFLFEHLLSGTKL